MRTENYENYYVGLDIGTDSVGYAVTKEDYSLCKFKGESMWGVTLFDPAHLAVERRGFRVSRRRLDRRQQRVRLVQELFAREIAKVDENFFKRIKESYLLSETADKKVRLFGTYAEQRAYGDANPNIRYSARADRKDRGLSRRGNRQGQNTESHYPLPIYRYT